ncbi:MAG: DUF3316 domain-containing protein [Prevotellaceae bacterium]|nr:DUF3316 domain-containing protein [Prevotellaceae bacterium]
MIFTIFLFTPFALFAQDIESYRLTTSNWQVCRVWASVKDPYLSPLKYKGSGVATSLNSKRFFQKKSEKFIATYGVSALYTSLLNPALTSKMQYFDGNANYGVHYRLQIKQYFALLAGASADIDLGLRYLSRNSNNPFNMDAAANLNFSVAVQLKIPMFRRVFQVDLEMRTPLVGAMFVPSRGASYYEMGTFDNALRNTFHFSNLSNRNGLLANIALHIPLNRLTVSITGNANALRFKANDAVYSYSTAGLGIGFKYSFVIFSGRKYSHL